MCEIPNFTCPIHKMRNFSGHSNFFGKQGRDPVMQGVNCKYPQALRSIVEMSLNGIRSPTAKLNRVLN